MAAVARPVIACDFTRRLVLIGGSSYAGETKKSVFGYLNYVLPERGVLPMHCSANETTDGTESAIFFGLSGTGKTTLSADPRRTHRPTSMAGRRTASTISRAAATPRPSS